ncbi:MAG: prepilin-type N-terminal cleavage/methylation domain-containing protein [Verrucomicrobia bacterium]|nr:prepilin-type N-terminal cleavage/methylation domain-containing protein [Verrucomicrobiota bacterium]
MNGSLSISGSEGRRAGAFSMLELLLAMSIMGVIVAALYGMFYHTQRALRMNVNQVDVLESTRLALDLIRRDVAQMAPCNRPGGTNFTAAVSRPYWRPSQGLPVVQVLPDGERRTNILQEAFLLTRRAEPFEAVVYRVLYAKNGVGVLARYATNALPWTFNPTNLCPAALSAPPELFIPALEGVVHFRFVPYDADGFPMVYWTTNNYGPNVWLEEDLGGETRSAFLNDRLPAYVELELGVLEPSAYQQYKSFPAGSAQAFKFLQNRAGQVHLFRQRMAVPRGSATRAIVR